MRARQLGGEQESPIVLLRDGKISPAEVLKSIDESIREKESCAFDVSLRYFQASEPI